MSDEIHAFVKRDFNDAGTEQHFAKGATPLLKAGVFANYEAGGLVRKATDAEVKANEPAGKPATAETKPKA